MLTQRRTDSSVEIPAAARPATPRAGAAYAADILALGRAALDVVGRAFRTAPEIRDSRVMARGPVDLEDLLLELEPMSAETPITELAARLGVSTAQLRSTALRLQRLSLVKVSSEGVSLTGAGRQKLARLETARTTVIRRIAGDLENMPPEHARLLIQALGTLIDRSEGVVEQHLGTRADKNRLR